MKRPLEDMPRRWDELRKQLRAYFFSCEWYKTYEFIEFLVSSSHIEEHIDLARFAKSCNHVLETERSGYRLVGKIITPITNKLEVLQIEEMLESPCETVRAQIRSAVEKLSLKPEPDLRNCIKDSICAVETAARLVAQMPKATLGEILPSLKDKLGLHPAQIKGWLAIYGWTSDDKSGIRHGMMDKGDNLTIDDARYMLVCCSAFANYLLRMAERIDVNPSGRPV